MTEADEFAPGGMFESGPVAMPDSPEQLAAKIRKERSGAIGQDWKAAVERQDAALDQLVAQAKGAQLALASNAPLILDLERKVIALESRVEELEAALDNERNLLRAALAASTEE